MSASGSLSRLEFVLNTAESISAAPANTAPATTTSSFLPSWLTTTTTTVTTTTATTSASSSASASASAAASAAAATATAAAKSANEWFGKLSAKVQGKEYVPSEVDLESGAGGGEAGSRGLLSKNPVSGVASQVSSELGALTTLSWKQRMMAFIMCAIVGVIMLFLAFSFLPMVFIGAPGQTTVGDHIRINSESLITVVTQVDSLFFCVVVTLLFFIAKFAISYALANLFLLGSSCFLVGPSKQFAQMFTSERALSSGIYLGSLLLLFYVSWQIRSFFIVVPVLIIQFLSLAFYVMSYIPFGQGMLKRICAWTIGRQFSFLSS